MKALQKELPLWKQRTKNDSFANFLLLDNCESKIEDVTEFGGIFVLVELKHAIAMSRDNLARSPKGYFPIWQSFPAWVRRPFTFNAATADINNEYFNEINEFQQSQVWQKLFWRTALSTFWCHQILSIPSIANKAIEILNLFVTTYLCEQLFLRTVEIKLKKKKTSFIAKLTWKYLFPNVELHISELVFERKIQNLHWFSANINSYIFVFVWNYFLLVLFINWSQ